MKWYYYLIIGILIIGMIVISSYIESPSEKEDVTITTDKTEYSQRENITITIKNNLNISLRNYPDSENTIFYNQPVGWGFIERFENGNWVKTEPLWRCGGRSDLRFLCWAKCESSGYFFVLGPKGTNNFHKDFMYFEWDQIRLICDLNISNIKRETVGAGTFRVSSTFWDANKEIGARKTFYSNEFTIKECSTDLDCKDLNCSTEKKPEPQPECVNNTCECTYSYCKEIGGCD